MTAHDLSQWVYEYFCICGRPKDALLKLRDTLDVFRQDSTAINAEQPYDLVTELHKLYPDDGAYWLALNFLDHMQLIEHGSSLPGWLTEQGGLVLGALYAHGVDPTAWGNHCSASSDKVCYCGQPVPGCDA